MTQSKPDAATIAQHEKLFETQLNLQSRLLDHIEQEDAFEVLDDAWAEFNLYNNVPMDPEDPEPALHFFPWVLFYWRRDVSDDALAHDAGLIDEIDGDEDDDENWLEEIESLSDDQIAEILSDALEGDAEAEDLAAALEGADEYDSDDDGDVHGTFPPLATLYMNSIDGADGADSPLVGQKLSVIERQFIEAAADAPYSFYKVTEIGPGPFVTLEDLIVPATKRVYAQVLVDMLENNDVIYGQVVTVDDASILCGVAPAVMPEFVEDAVAQARERIESLVADMDEDWRHDMEFELRGLYQEFVAELQEASGDDDTDELGGDNGEPLIKH